MKKFLLLFFLMIFSLGQSQNMISNSYFTSGSTGWTLNSTGTVIAGEVVYSPTNAAGNPWDNELKWTGLSLTNSATYTVTFRARAASNRTMSVNLQNTGIWSDQFRNNSVALTTTMTVYTYTFNATSTNSNVQLNFHMAGTGSTAAVYIDDVTLVPGTATQCTNFIQDGTETGVDCGGSCPNACLITPTYAPYTVGPKFVGDAPFSATATPTNGSTGAITYTSSTPAVATINPTTGLVTILTAGTTTITANQAAVAGYYAGSTSAVLTVTIAPPSAAATTPPVRVSTDVVSVYSDAYTVGVSSPTYGSSTAVTPGGNATRLYTSTGGGQINFTGTTAASGMTFLHIDVYTMTTTATQVKIQVGGSLSPNKVTPNGVWTSLDIPVTDFTAGTFNSVALIAIQPYAGAGTFYVDNVYFYKYPAPTLTDFTVPAKLVGDPDFTITPPTSNNATGTFSYTSSNTNVATIVNGNQIHIVGLAGNSTITATQAASGLFSSGSTTATFTVTAASPAPTLGTFTVAPKMTGDPDFTITAPTSNNNDPAATFSYTSSNTNVATIVNGNQIRVVGTGTSTITAIQAAAGSYSAGSTTASFVVSLGAAPTQITRNSWDVVSVFAGAYTDVAGTDFNPFWGQASNHPNNMTTPSYGGDVVKQYQNSGNYQGTRLGSDINVSAINKLYVNIYSPTLTSLQLYLIKTTDGAVERFVTVPLTPGRWNNVNIDVNSTNFPGLDLTKIREIKYVYTAGTTLVVDNFYFWRVATLPPATVGTFTVAGQSLGAPNYTLVPPTSNNTSPFTYTSSNSSVATVVNGNQLQINGVGNSTITASQVSDGTYEATASIATLVVSPNASPAPPVRVANDIVSLYTGTPSVYANAPSYNLVKKGGNATSNFNVANGSNTCIEVNGMGFIVLGDTSNRLLNVTGMTNLHLDIYLNTPLSSMFFWITTSTGDIRRDIPNLVAGWNSININLSEFPGIDLTKIAGLKFEQNQALRQIYLDNMYFSKESVITPSQCNQTLATIDSPVYSSLIRGAESYLWEVTELDDSNQPVVGGAQTKITPLRQFIFSSMLPKFAYGKTYSIRVSTKVGGVDGPYSVACKVTTPSLLAQLTSCPTTLTSLEQLHYSTLIKYTSYYRFKVSNTAFDFESIYDAAKSSRKFKLSNLSNAAGLLPGTAYNVQVSYLNPDGSYAPYGPVCTMTTPAAVGKFVENNTIEGFDVISYPNPFTNNFNLNLTSVSQEKVAINVYDMVGRLVENRNSEKSELESIQIGNNLQAGVYNVIVSQGMNVKTLRVVKR